MSSMVRFEIAIRKRVFSYSYEPDSKVFLIKQGHVKIMRRVNDEKETIVDILGSGEFFGPLSGGTDVRSSNSPEEYASVIDDAIICVFDRADFERALRDIPSMQHQVLALVAEKVERVTERLVDMAFLTARDRIFGFLQRVGSRFGKQVDGEVRVPIQLSHAEIGLLTGTSRQTVATILSDFRRSGIASVLQNEIIIH